MCEHENEQDVSGRTETYRLLQCDTLVPCHQTLHVDDVREGRREEIRVLAAKTARCVSRLRPSLPFITKGGRRG